MEKNFGKDTAKKPVKPNKSSGGKAVQPKTGKQKSTGKKV